MVGAVMATHPSMLLGAARLLLSRRGEFAGRVVLLFQPGEEGYHGARYMIEDGLLAAADRLVITVRGRGGHASAPFLAIDPIAVAAELIPSPFSSWSPGRSTPSIPRSSRSRG
jgi:hippurate hydrolase